MKVFQYIKNRFFHQVQKFTGENITKYYSNIGLSETYAKFIAGAV